MRWYPSVVRAATLAASLAAVPAAVDAQGYTSLNRVYTLQGCLEGISCHTVTLSVYDLRLATEAPFPPQYPFHHPKDGGVWQSLGYDVIDGYLERGVALAPPFQFGTAAVPYGFTTATGAATAPISFQGTHSLYSNCNPFFAPARMSACLGDGWDGGMHGGWISATGHDHPVAFVTPDWNPDEFLVRLALGAPGTWATPTDPQVTLRLRVTGVQFVGPQTTVPEPATVALTATGLLAVGLLARARRRVARTPCATRG